MASMELAEEKELRAGLNPSQLPTNKRLSIDVVKSPSMDDAIQSKDVMDEYSVKVRKPYTITKQREKWTEEEHEKFLEALKLYGRSWRQIQEHIGTKTAVQIRSHAQKFFSKVVREPGANSVIDIPPPRPKRKPLHPYPRKYGNSCTAANPTAGQSRLALVSSSSGSDQENGSPVSVLSAVQSDAFGSSISNPSTGCTSPVSLDSGNNNPVLVTDQEADEENVASQLTRVDHSHEEDHECKNADLSEEDSVEEVQETSLKLFGKTVVIPDPRKVFSLAQGHEDREHSSQSPNREALQASLVGDSPAYAALNGWFLPYNSFPFHFGEAMDAKIAAPLHIWWPCYGFPAGHPRSLSTATWMEATDESDAGKIPLAESSSDSEGDAQTAPENCKVVESLGKTEISELASNFELKPSANSAFVRVQPSSGAQPVRGFVPYKRCKLD